MQPRYGKSVIMVALGDLAALSALRGKSPVMVIIDEISSVAITKLIKHLDPVMPVEVSADYTGRRNKSTRKRDKASRWS